MKALSGIERAIVKTAKPYPDIYREAERGGIKVDWKVDTKHTVVTAYDGKGGFVRSCYFNAEPDAALYNEYSY